jgi:hypothetical protein
VERLARMMEVAGPQMMMFGQAMKQGRVKTLTFTKAGVYKFTTTVAPMAGMLEVATTGPDNNLRLMVTVAQWLPPRWQTPLLTEGRRLCSGTRSGAAAVSKEIESDTSVLSDDVGRRQVRARLLARSFAKPVRETASLGAAVHPRRPPGRLRAQDDGRNLVAVERRQDL